MRYVDIDTLRPPNGWPARALNAKRAVMGGVEPNDYGNIWRELKDSLADLLNDKCWFCEVSIVRSDNAVDHFRPKGRVSDAAEEHFGYRWLAFTKENFRYACTYCNSRRIDVENATAGGKADRFPLLDETTRVYAEGPLDLEAPVLLDPCVWNDCKLLGSQVEDGRPCATSSEPTEKYRAEQSIEIYHLHHEPTCRLRHGTTVQLISDIESGKRQFLLSSQDPTKEIDFNTVAKKILRTISPGAPFSGDMRFIMRGQRHSDHPWIQDLLEV